MKALLLCLALLLAGCAAKKRTIAAPAAPGDVFQVGSSEVGR